MKIVWKVAEAPTGRYRSFEKRAWPSAYYGSAEGKPAASLSCATEYVPKLVREGAHTPIMITVYHHNHADKQGPWKLFKMQRTAATLDEAKLRVEAFLKQHPEFAPKE